MTEAGIEYIRIRQLVVEGKHAEALVRAFGDEAREIARLPLGGSLARYLLLGLPTGGFLAAILRNDLFQAIRRADDENVGRIADYVRVLFRAAPAHSFGSIEKVEQWQRQGGWCGRHGDATPDSDPDGEPS